MKKFFSMLTASLLLSGLSVSFWSCGGGDEEPAVEPTKMTVSPTSLLFSASGGSQTVKIQSNASWSLIPSVGWITVSPMTGTGNSTVVVSLSEQTTMRERSCEIIVQTDDDRKREIVYVTQQGAKSALSVDVSELIFEENAKCERTIRITSNTKWSISDVPEWLDLSTTNGNGDASVQLITATDNNSSAERMGEIKISTSEGEYRKVAVQQKGKYVKDCKVDVADILTMANSVAFKYDFGSNVSYYYELATYPEVIERMTDAEIVEELLKGTRYIPSDGSLASFDLDPRTNYTLCFVAFNKEDRQGELTFVDFSTPTDVNQAEAWISDVWFDDQYWHWTETISAYCRYYYNYTDTGSSPSDIAFWYDSDAIIAWYLRGYIEEYPDQFSPIVQSSEWYGPRTEDDTCIQLITWGVGLDDKFAGTINNFCGNIGSETRSTSAHARRPLGKSYKVNYSKEEVYEKLHGRITLVAQ